MRAFALAAVALAAAAAWYYPTWQADRLEAEVERQFTAEREHMERDLADAGRMAPDVEGRAAVLAKIVPSYRALYARYTQAPAPRFAKRAAIVVKVLDDLTDLRQRMADALEFERIWPMLRPEVRDREGRSPVFDPRAFALVKAQSEFFAAMEPEIEKRRGSARRAITTSGLPEQHRIELWGDIDAAYTSLLLQARQYEHITDGVVAIGKLYAFLGLHRDDYRMGVGGVVFDDPVLGEQFRVLNDAVSDQVYSHAHRHGIR